jgi:hypothetical protein
MTEGVNIQRSENFRPQGLLQNFAVCLKQAAQGLALVRVQMESSKRNIPTSKTDIYITCFTAVTSQYPHLVRGLLRGTLLALHGGTEELHTEPRSQQPYLNSGRP